MTHALKTVPPFFKDVVEGKKTFEVRKNDRLFKVGDKLLLQEFHGDKYTGQEWEGHITYILDSSDFCKKGFVIMGIQENIVHSD
jgi:hypothetical protein